MATIGSIISLILIFIPTITADSVVEFTVDDEHTLENFTDYSAKHGANVDFLRLYWNVDNTTAELFKPFPRLLTIQILFLNNEPLVQPDLFRYNGNLTTILIKYGHFNSGDFLQLNHLHDLKKLELLNATSSAIIDKKRLDLPSLTHLLIVGENITVTDDVFEKMPNLVYIVIGGSNCKQLPSSLSKLSNLTSVSFSKSLISELNAEDLAKSSQSLKVFMLNYGKLTKISLPKSLPNLQILNFGNNQLTDIPDSLFNSTPSLTALAVYENKLKRFPTLSVARLDLLTNLDLSDNNLEEFNLTYGKGQRQELQVLNLCQNRLKFVHIPKMKGDLQLNDNQISRIDRNTFSSGSSFDFINFSSNPIGEIDQRTFENITLPIVVEISNISVTRFPLDCLNDARGIQYLMLTGNPLLQRVIATNSTKLPENFLAVVLYNNAKLSFVDPDGYLMRSSRNGTLFILGGSFECSCNLVSLFKDDNSFVDVNFVEYKPVCSNANNLTFADFSDDNDKYCENGTYTKAFPHG